MRQHFSEAATETCFSDVFDRFDQDDLKISSKELIFQRGSNKRLTGTF